MIKPTEQSSSSPHTLQDELIGKLKVALMAKRLEQPSDQTDIETAFAADASWSGQHARLTKSKGWDEPELT